MELLNNSKNFDEFLYKQIFAKKMYEKSKAWNCFYNFYPYLDLLL